MTEKLQLEDLLNRLQTLSFSPPLTSLKSCKRGKEVITFLDTFLRQELH